MNLRHIRFCSLLGAVLIILGIPPGGLCFDYSKAENAKYVVSYLGMPVVRVSLEGTPITEPDSGAYRISYTAKTTRFWNLFHSIDNSYSTLLDSIGLPMSYRREINERSVVRISEQQFDHRFNRIYYEGNTAIDHPGPLETFFSGIYRMRVSPLEIGLTDSFYINVEKAAWSVVWTVEEMRDVKIDNRRILCYQIDVKFISATANAKRLPSDALSKHLVSENTELKILLSDDDWRLPIRMEFKLSPFDVKAEITEFPAMYPEQVRPQ